VHHLAQGDIAEALKAIDAGTALVEAEHKAGLAAAPHVREAQSPETSAPSTASSSPLGSPHADEEANNLAGSHDGDDTAAIKARATIAAGQGPSEKGPLDARTVAAAAASLQVGCSAQVFRVSTCVMHARFACCSGGHLS